MKYGAGILFLSFFSSAWVTPLLSQDMPVPLHVQAALFKKIFGYSLSLSDPNNPKIAIVEPTSGAGSLVQDAFTKIKLEKTQLMSLDDFISTNGKGYEIAYICPGIKSDKLKKIFISGKILSISGVPAYYDNGTVSISLTLKNNKSQILINVDRAKNEGHRFSASFLKMTQGG
jgi:hypothetical protein